MYAMGRCALVQDIELYTGVLTIGDALGTWMTCQMGCKATTAFLRYVTATELIYVG